MNAELINNLMTTQNAPNYINKLKIKKQKTLKRERMLRRNY